MREALRLFRDDRSLDRDLLRISALLARLANSEYRVANPQIRDAGTDGSDHPGKIPSEDQWELCRFVLTGAHLPIRSIDAGSMDVDDHLAGRGNGIRQIAVAQYIRPAVLFDESSLHLLPL